MSWYVAEAIFHSSVSGAGPDYVPLVERSWFLVAAESEIEAQPKALVLGRAKEHSYLNSDGEQVDWTLQRIDRTREVLEGELSDGVELWSCISRREGREQGVIAQLPD